MSNSRVLEILKYRFDESTLLAEGTPGQNRVSQLYQNCSAVLTAVARATVYGRATAFVNGSPECPLRAYALENLVGYAKVHFEETSLGEADVLLLRMQNRVWAEIYEDPQLGR